LPNRNVTWTSCSCEAAFCFDLTKWRFMREIAAVLFCNQNQLSQVILHLGVICMHTQPFIDFSEKDCNYFMYIKCCVQFIAQNLKKYLCDSVRWEKKYCCSFNWQHKELRQHQCNSIYCSMFWNSTSRKGTLKFVVLELVTVVVGRILYIVLSVYQYLLLYYMCW